MSSSDTPVAAARGVASLEEARDWLKARRIEDIECIVPDQAGVPKGKMMPTEKFFSGTTMTMPGSIFMQTISGDYPDLPDEVDYDPAEGGPVLQAGLLDARRRPLGERSDRPTPPRCL